ncbi:hypothetical protein SLEP1_g25255 [Rubroshorea leprosula]|uniref:Phytocyanin domain-containing protein n=1 Tax=Rubroshorea leprosula TaxID=152421 RepID=A0AAV5JII9_9ROSI|nr:hypothetical protein SLEP1_g25255 [Rubroshorea leprosula]
MANTIFGSNNHHKSKAVHLIGLFCLFLLVSKAQAREFTVGNSRWEVPATSTQSYNQWAENNRFQIGDSLVFVYSPDKDSVLEVTKDAYDNCGTDTPLTKYTDGHTVVGLNRSGPFYFISGNKDNCLKGEKLIVVVMADRSNSSAPPTASPPTPPASVPAPAPAPAGESPPSGAVEINPTPAPTEQPPPTSAPTEQPPPSAASSTFVSVAGSIGAFLASSLLLSF